MYGALNAAGSLQVRTLSRFYTDRHRSECFYTFYIVRRGIGGDGGDGLRRGDVRRWANFESSDFNENLSD